MVDLVIGALQGKVWGDTRTVFCGNNVKVDVIHTKAGWQCSLHRHRASYNLFHVISGRLLVRTHKDGLEDETVLGPGESTFARPGDKHQFISLQDCVVLEVYWVTLDPHDIERFSQGGPAPEVEETQVSER